MSSSLKERIDEILENVNGCQVSNTVADVCQGSAILKDVCGLIELSAAPYFGLTLNADENYIVPLTIVDVASNLCEWISLVGKRVRLRCAVVVIEKFYIKSKHTEDQNISIFVKWDDVQFGSIMTAMDAAVEVNQLVDSSVVDDRNTSLKENHLPDSTVADNILEGHVPDKVILPKQLTYRIIVHCVATPFSVEQSVYCLLFVSYISCSGLVKRCWLILQDEQISWRHFLLPNRDYDIKLPTNLESYYIETSLKPLNKVFPNLNRGLSVMLHHSELFPTLDSVLLPHQSSILLRPNSECSKYVVMYAGYPFQSWFSIDEADHVNKELINIYGRVEHIRYDNEVIHKSCYMCIHAPPKEPTILEPKPSLLHNWVNPSQSPLLPGNKEAWELPLIKGTNNSISMNTGVPGGMVQIIKLCDIVSGKEKSVYIKHSNAATTQQLCRLLPGMEICITHLNRRQSGSMNMYYLGTFLSSLTILSCPSNQILSECWGTYGLRELKPDFREKMWGVLDAFSVSKVAITARCKVCYSLFEKNHCSRQCSPNPGFSSSAHAIGRIHITNCNNEITVEKVVIKNEHVRKWLFIPDDEWENLLNAAADEEIICFINNNYKNLPENPKNLSDFLKLYCEIARPKCKFYISVRKLITSAGENPLYYCIHLEPFNVERLHTVAEYVKAFVSSKNA